MYCSPLPPSDPTRLPAVVQQWIGRRLRGPRPTRDFIRRTACYGSGWRSTRPDVDCLKLIPPDALARALHEAAVQ